jgi:hypothetical protein
MKSSRVKEGSRLSFGRVLARFRHRPGGVPMRPGKVPTEDQQCSNLDSGI